MIRLLQNKFLHTSFRYFSRNLFAVFPGGQQNEVSHWHRIIDEAGLELVKVIRVRPDTRSIFLVKHPERGLCVLKTFFATRYGNGGLAKLLIAEMVSKSSARIFPRIYSATESYTLEEYIDGEPFRAWMKERFELAAAEEYFLELKRWSEGSRFADRGAYLHAYEIQEICMSYIRKCFWLSRYSSPLTNLASVARLSSLGGGLRQRMQWLVDSTTRVRIPRASMCGDMGNVNVIVQRSSNRLYNIDYEYMGPGHWGFDCAYFISSLRKMGDPEAIVGPLEELVFSADYLGSTQSADFFRALSSILCDVSRLFFRPSEDTRVRLPQAG